MKTKENVRNLGFRNLNMHSMYTDTVVFSPT